MNIAYQKGITNPEIIVSKNFTYYQAGHYFNIKIVEIDFFDSDESMNSSYNLESKLDNHTNKNFLFIITSAPAFNHCNFDPISKIEVF